MKEQKFNLIINKGIEEGFETRSLDKKDFLRETSAIINKPKKIFLGLGDFLEVGDYNKLLDTIFFDKEGIKLESILDKTNRQISGDGDVPVSFFKLAVYFPDFLLKYVPVFFVSIIGKKSRLFPGAERFIKFIKEYDPLILSAVPYDIAIEIIKRLDLDENNLVATEYKIENDDNNKKIYSGDINQFVSGNRKSIEIRKVMIENKLTEDDILYIGCGEAGLKTFSSVNSIAFNPSESVIPESRITIYGSSLESLLVLFNFDGELEKFLLSEVTDEYLPSLIVYSEKNEKSQELIDLELNHRHMQNNIVGQRIEFSGESYKSVEREIDVAFGGSSFDIHNVRKKINERMDIYKENPQDLVKKIYGIAKGRYKKFYKNGSY